MGSFVPLNVSIRGILNFAGRGKCSTPGCEQGFNLLYQGVHRDRSAALYRFLHVAELLLDILEPLLL